jgi:hypothetical protein
MRLANLVTLLTFVSGCELGGPTAFNTPSGSGGVHLMPKSDGIKADQFASKASLKYYGGPIIPSVKVYTVFWNSKVPNQSELNAFYTDVTNSAYFDWLTEYDTSSQSIGRGSFGGSVVDTGAPSGSTIDDSDVQAEVARLIDAGKLPKNDGNNLYMVHFPAGVTITSGSDTSCNQFCAYHGTFTHGGSDAFYGVIPDLSGGCSTGCGSSTKLDNTTSVSSHEMIEAVTDPAIGLATAIGKPIAWYDSSNGEIGDICNAEQGTIDGYTVQKEWSNANGACIITGGSSTGSGFTVAVSPSSQSASPGGSASYSINTGGSGTVALTLSGLPTGVTGKFSPASVSAGGVSTLTLTVSSTAAAVSKSYTEKGTSGSPSHTASASITVGGGSTGGGGDQITNGSFDGGTVTGWTTAGNVKATTTTAHSPSYSARVGWTTAHVADSTMSQAITVPSGGATLTFWYHDHCTSGSTGDKQSVVLLDSSGKTLETYLSECKSTSWTQATEDLSAYAGQTVTLEFHAHDVGSSGDSVYLLVDDVSVN